MYGEGRGIDDQVPPKRRSGDGNNRNTVAPSLKEIMTVKRKFASKRVSAWRWGRLDASFLNIDVDGVCTKRLGGMTPVQPTTDKQDI